MPTAIFAWKSPRRFPFLRWCIFPAFSEEIILWCSWEFKFIELDDAFSTGSSIMPQKKNPDVCGAYPRQERPRFGDLMALLTMMKGLPLAYNKDMQEDKGGCFDAVDTLRLCLTPFIPMLLQTMRVLTDNMRSQRQRASSTQRIARIIWWLQKGLPFRDAYKITGELVALCIERGLTLETLPIDEYKKGL